MSVSFDSSEFRKALGSFTTGVTIVTTHCEKLGDVGLTANSFNSVSLDPPLVLWSLAKSAGSLPAFANAGYFAVHILSEEQQSLSNQFAKRGSDKFANLSLDRGPDNIPLLNEYAARFVCKTAYKYEGGDHIIFVGEVAKFDRFEKPPLLFHSGQYGKISKASADNDQVADDSLALLLRRSYQQLIEPLTAEIARENLSIFQHYFLAYVARSKEKTLAELLESASTGEGLPSEGEISELFHRGLIAKSDSGYIRLTNKGIDLRIELASIYKSIESDALKNLAIEKAQQLKILLSHLLNSLEKNNHDAESLTLK